MFLFQINVFLSLTLSVNQSINISSGGIKNKIRINKLKPSQLSHISLVCSNVSYCLSRTNSCDLHSYTFTKQMLTYSVKFAFLSLSLVAVKLYYTVVIANYNVSILIYYFCSKNTVSMRGVQPMASGLHAAQDGCEGGPTQSCKFT